MTNSDILTEHRRLAILQILNADSDYKANSVMLHSTLKLLGQGAALSVVEGDIAWLEAQGLLAQQQLPGCTVCTLRRAGIDAAEGTSKYPGIAKPLPND